MLRSLGRRRAVLVWIDPKGRWFLQRGAASLRRPSRRRPVRLEPGLGLRVGARALPVDVVFPVLHGPFGEDGTVQGLLEMLDLPYVGSGVLGSAAGMDKEITKRLAGLAGLPQLPYAVLREPRDLAKARRLGLPVFVKPARLGSSVGVYKVKKAADLAGAVRKAFRFDTTVLVEKGVPAREIECAVIGGDGKADVARVVGEIRPNAEFYSYEAKYLDPDGARLLVPAELTAAQARAAREMAAKAFVALGCHGLARVDFLMDKRTGKLWFNEPNTMPGMTSISMFPKLWAASGVPLPRVVDRLIELALKRHRKRSKLRITRD